MKEYLNGVLQELNKVSWPTTKQGVRLSSIVLIFIFFAAFGLATTDKGLSGLKSTLMNSFSFSLESNNNPKVEMEDMTTTTTSEDTLETEESTSSE